MAMETLEEQVNLNPGGGCPDSRGRNGFREAYTKLTVRKDRGVETPSHREPHQEDDRIGDK
jgi:hypothetical protein